MAQKVHLQNGLLGAHGLDGKALGAHDVELALLVDVELLGDLGYDGIAAKTLGKAGLVLADLAVDLAHRLVDRAAHIAVGVLTDRTEQCAVGTAEHHLDNAAILLLHGEGHSCFGFLLKILLQLADLFLGIGLDGVVQGDLLAGKCELHNGSLLSISASRESKKEVLADSLFTFTDYSMKRKNSQ